MKYIMLGLALSVVVLAYTTTEPYYLTVRGQRVLRIGFVPHIEANAAPVAASVDTSNADDMTLKRPPSVTAQQIDDVLRQYNSPAVGSGKDFVALGQQYGIDPAYALAFFIHESSAGTKGVAIETRGIGNIICTPGYQCADGFRSYADWHSAIEDWYKLLDTEYIPNGRTTVDTVLPVYCPVSDGCDPAGYAATVQTLVRQWRQAPHAMRHTITTPEQIGARFTTTGDVWCFQSAACQHLGTDYLAPQGSEVDLPYPATFLDTGSYTDDARYGNYVEWTLDDGCVLYLGHLQNVPALNVGQRYAAGTPVGQTNSKGHTHVQLRCNGQLVDFEQYQVSQK